MSVNLYLPTLYFLLKRVLVQLNYIYIKNYSLYILRIELYTSVSDHWCKAVLAITGVKLKEYTNHKKI